MVMRKLLQEVYGAYRKSTTRIKINTLSLEDEKKTTETSNPAYESWKEQKEIVDGLMNKEKVAEKLPPELLRILSQPIPNKTITTETITKKITAKQLNEVEKDIDTLYLREEDKECLMSSLTQFRDKKKLLKELGLQNKLNILLYGEPGTGKSTTIQAVATYLQKNIYYIDIQKAVLNEDLLMLFEYVNKNVPNGGIVVIEDIDAMTKVVHKRTAECSQDITVTDLVAGQTKTLTLEFFLNILQGTLTADDSIFIVTTNHLETLDPAFYRDGRFDVKIQLKLCDRFQIGQIYKRMMGKELDKSVLERIKEDKYSPASVIFRVKNFLFNSRAKPDEIMKPFLDVWKLIFSQCFRG